MVGSLLPRYQQSASLTNLEVGISALPFFSNLNSTTIRNGVHSHGPRGQKPASVSQANHLRNKHCLSGYCVRH